MESVVKEKPGMKPLFEIALNIDLKLPENHPSNMHHHVKVPDEQQNPSSLTNWHVPRGMHNQDYPTDLSRAHSVYKSHQKVAIISTCQKDILRDVKHHHHHLPIALQIQVH